MQTPHSLEFVPQRLHIRQSHPCKTPTTKHFPQRTNVMPRSSTVDANARSVGGSHGVRKEIEVGNRGPCDTPSSACARQSASTDPALAEARVHSPPSADAHKMTSFGPTRSARAPPAICAKVAVEVRSDMEGGWRSDNAYAPGRISSRGNMRTGAFHGWQPRSPSPHRRRQ